MLIRIICTAGISLLVSQAQDISVSAPVAVGSNITSTVTNSTKNTISAFLVVCRMYEGPELRREVHRYMDARVNFSDSALAPGDARSVDLFPAASASKYQYVVQLQAALLANGSSIGDVASVSFLRERRQRVYGSLGIYEAILHSALAVGGRLAAIGAVEQEHANQLQLARQERLNLGLRSAEDLVARFVSDALGQQSDVCDDACSVRRLKLALDGIASWKSRVSTGLAEAETSAQ